jgi:hypothetical protein
MRIRRIGLAAIVASTLASGHALAANYVRSGMGVAYNGSNDIYVGYGYPVVAGVEYNWGGGTFTIDNKGVGVVPPSPNGGGLQGNDDPIYVYYYNDANFHSGIAFSTFGPIYTGEINFPGGNFAINNVAFHWWQTTFLGSYLNDSSGNIIPFHRAGDEVFLSKPYGTGSQPFSGAGIPEPHAINFVDDKGFAVANAGGLVSASALLVDFNVQESHPLAPPTNILVAYGNNGCPNETDQQFTVASSNGGSFRRVAVQAGVGNFWLARCKAIPANDVITVSASITGYVEHLTLPRSF